MIDFPRLYGAPLMSPIAVQPLLRDPEKHWKKGRSAYEAAHSWIRAGQRQVGGLPPRVKELVASAPEWTPVEMVAGFFEHATALDTQRSPSSNDLLALCGIGEGLGVIAVEAKAGEAFGQLISDWNTTEGRSARLRWACDFLHVTSETCASLRWQLFHRTASALIEAKRFRAKHAIMLVHDFGQHLSGLDDYKAFAGAIGMHGADVGALSEPLVLQDVSLRLAWVRDVPTVE